MQTANEGAAAQIDAMFQEQQQLTQRGSDLAAGVGGMQAERTALESCVLELSGKAVALERWLADNEAKTPEGEVDADGAIVAADVLSAQALEAQAEDMAVEDTLYSLDKALQEGALQPEAYMKQVRNHCYKQFFVRALGNKVAARQHELRRNTAPRHSHAPRPPMHVQMPQVFISFFLSL